MYKRKDKWKSNECMEYEHRNKDKLTDLKKGRRINVEKKRQV